MIKTLYKQKDGKHLQWSIEYTDTYFFTTSGYFGGVLTSSQPTYPTPKNVGKNNETTVKEQVLSEVNALIKKKIEKGYSEHITANITPQISPMLAKNFQDYAAKLKFPVYIQPKLDGVRCAITAKGLFSRNNKEFLACPHLLNKDKINDLMKTYNINFFDGELYNHDLHDDFNTIVSLVKRQKPDNADLALAELKIKYYIYDLAIDGMSFSQRSKLISEIAKDISNWVIVPTYLCNNLSEIEQYHQKFIKNGYEGSIIRIDAPYEYKRSNVLLKKKDFIDEEFKILDVVEGVGNRSGMAGYLVLETADGKKFSASLSFSWDESKQILKDKENYIGTLAKVKFFSYTPDGVPRFPTTIELNRADI